MRTFLAKRKEMNLVVSIKRYCTATGIGTNIQLTELNYTSIITELLRHLGPIHGRQTRDLTLLQSVRDCLWAPINLLFNDYGSLSWSQAVGA
jgi:hypothetical protein